MDNLIIEAEKHVVNLLNDELNSSHTYHNLPHTQRVVEKVKELIEAHDLNENDINNLIIAAWFHDVGYINGVDNHEEESVKILNHFLKQHEVSHENTESISKIILATKMGYEPTSLLEKIIRDADSSHVGSKEFNDTSRLLRKEWELTCNKKLTDKEWVKENIDFLTNNHRFYTEYASVNWDKRKEKNLAKLIKSRKKRQKKLKTEQLKAKYKAQYKNESPERGVQTFYRVALRNHIKLSDIADTKANILLSVNAIIISVVLANLISKLDNNPYLIWPTVIFTVFSVISMVMSIIATRPNVTSGEFTKEDVRNQKVNLSFFGNFHKMKLEEFEWAIQEMVNDKDYIYKALTKDLYFLGKVLERKYRLLRVTYTVFMIGIITSLIAFGIAVKNNPGIDIQEVLDPNSQTQIIKQDD